MAAVAVQNSFEAVAREWVDKYSGDWVVNYKSHIMHKLEDMIFPAIGKKPIKSITAPELLAALRKIEGGAVRYVWRISQCANVAGYLAMPLLPAEPKGMLPMTCAERSLPCGQ